MSFITLHFSDFIYVVTSTSLLTSWDWRPLKLIKVPSGRLDDVLKRKRKKMLLNAAHAQMSDTFRFSAKVTMRQGTLRVYQIFTYKCIYLLATTAKKTETLTMIFLSWWQCANNKTRYDFMVPLLCNWKLKRSRGWNDSGIRNEMLLGSANLLCETIFNPWMKRASSRGTKDSKRQRLNSSIES